MSKFDIFRIEELAVFRKLGEEGEKGIMDYGTKFVRADDE